MRIQLASAKTTAAGTLQQRHDLLDAWLAALNQLDNPMRRRAAKIRQEQRPRRDIPQGRFRAGELGLLLHFDGAHRRAL
jgi:hypothetical protein